MNRPAIRQAHRFDSMPQHELPKNPKQLIAFLKTTTEKLYQHFDYVWVFNELFLNLQKIGFNITDYCILYHIAQKSEKYPFNTFALSRKNIANNLSISIDTINKVMPFLKRAIYHDGKPLIITVTNKSYYHDHDKKLVEKDSKSYKKSYVSETIQVNQAFISDLNKCLLAMRNESPIKRTIVIPAIAAEFGWTLHQYYQVEVCNTTQKINKEGVKNKKATAESNGISRQNFYTSVFRYEIKGKILNFLYRNEYGYNKEKSPIKVKKSFEEEKERFFHHMNIFTAYRPKENSDQEAAEICKLWRKHASEMVMSIAQSNTLTELVIGKIVGKTKDLVTDNFLNKYSQEFENCMSSFHEFAAEHQHFYGKVKNTKLFESSLDALLELQGQGKLFSNLKENYRNIDNCKLSTSEEIRDFGIHFHSFWTKLEKYINQYYFDVSNMLKTVKVF